MRKPRKLQDGARYHVTARANRKEMIFDPDPVKDLFLSVIKRAHRKYDFRIENFCVMDNHFHLIIQPRNGANLSAIMQWIMSVFAMAYNRSRGITGHVWGNRFFSRIIDSLKDFLQIFDYIDGNPVRANRVTDPQDWPHGGLAHIRQGRRDIIEEPQEWIPWLFPLHKVLELA